MKEQPVETASWLKELDTGTWTGHTWKEVEALDPEGVERYRADWREAAGGGESFEDVYQRVEKGLQALLHTEDPAAKILLCTHAMPVRIIPIVLMHLPKDTYWHIIPGQGVYSKLTAYPEKDLYFSLAAWNVGPENSWRP